MARRKVTIDKEQFEKLCELQCTLAEIANYFRCSDDTIERWCKREYKLGFAEVFKQKRQGGFTSLRRNQMALSETSAAMAIFLGKNWLGQTDVVQQHNHFDDGFIEALSGTAAEDWSDGEDSSS